MGPRPLTLVLLAAAAAALTAGPVAADAASARAFDVRAFGAAGDGRHDDAAAIDRAIAAAASSPGARDRAGRATVVLPAGAYRADRSIHLRSHVTIRLARGATLIGSRDGTGYDLPEPNPATPRWIDTGHGHFHDAVIWGERLRDVAIVGEGTIDGGGRLLTGEPIAGHADKLIAIARCDGLTVSGVTLRRGGHFALLTNGCDHIRSDRLTIETAGDRDGWNVVNGRHVRITRLVSHAFDDALAFKSDWALGATLPSGDVSVRAAWLSSGCCNALMFGSETCGPFAHYRFSDITVTGAGKSGLGLVSMDGARISDVRYDHVRMTGVAGALMEKLGTRRHCGGRPPPVGSISGVRYDDVRATSTGAYAATLWGRAGDPIADVTFEHVRLTARGDAAGAATVAAAGAFGGALPREDGALYNPDSIGPRPASVLYLHDVAGVRLRDVALRSAVATDPRPAALADDAAAGAADGMAAAALARLALVPARALSLRDVTVRSR
ncbi:MAG: carbohydrate binding family 6 [Conexibacter sp.]|nr:carbohydrate binding family 6 [Conexibacter sp.]